jgi:membrane protein YqaA with SNARE-associated domain
MKGILGWVRGTALAFGGAGLFAAAFVDASFLSLPEINDLLIVWMVTLHKGRLIYYATMCTTGSLAGCLVLYWLARKSGEVFLRKRFKAGGVERGMEAFRRHGLLALFVPAILPPPAPFKVFVVAAGVARVPVRSFVLAIGVGRGLRYFGEGLLAVWFGDLAITYTKEHGNQVALGVAAVILVAGVAYAWWTRRGSRAARPATHDSERPPGTRESND